MLLVGTPYSTAIRKFFHSLSGLLSLSSESDLGQSVTAKVCYRVTDKVTVWSKFAPRRMLGVVVSEVWFC